VVFAALRFFIKRQEMRTTEVKFNSEKINGSVVMEVSPGRERLKILKEINLTPDETGSLRFNSTTIDSLIKGTELIEKKIKSIYLLVGDQEITTFEDLEYSSAFNEVITTLIGVLINGNEKLGN
jgi:hypothetical protein